MPIVELSKRGGAEKGDEDQRKGMKIRERGSVERKKSCSEKGIAIRERGRRGGRIPGETKSSEKGVES